MTRWNDSTIEAALDQRHVRYAVLVEMQFVSATQRVFNGVGEITYSGQIYSGIGTYGSMSELVERPNARDFTPLRLVLSGVDAALVAKVPNRADYFQRPVRLTFLPFNTETWQAITTVPAPIWRGFMDRMFYRRTAGLDGAAPTAEIILECRHHGTIWSKSTDFYFTHEHQQRLVAGDTGLQRIPALVNLELLWGGKKANLGGSFGPGGGGGGDGFDTRNQD